MARMRVRGQPRKLLEIRQDASPIFAALLIVPFVALLATGAANIATHIVPDFWIGPLALAVPFCVAYLFSPPPFARTRKFPTMIVAAALLYAAMCVADFVLIDTSFLPIFTRRMEFMVFIIFFIVLMRNSPSAFAITTLRWCMPIATLGVIADSYFPPMTAFLNKIMPSERLAYADAHRAFGLFINPNAAGSILALFSVLCSYGLSIPKRAFFYAVGLAGILASGSRGSLLLWAAGIVLCEILTVNPAGKVRVLWIRAAAGVTALVVVAAIAAAHNQGTRAVSVDPGGGQASVARLTTTGDASTRDRLILMQHAWSVFQSRPAFGWGVGYDYNWDMPLPVHNIYLGMLVEHGLAGILWLMFFFFTLTKSPAPFNVIAPVMIAIKGITNHSVFNEIDDAFVLAMFATGRGWIPAQTERPRVASPRSYSRPAPRRRIPPTHPADTHSEPADSSAVQNS